MDEETRGTTMKNRFKRMPLALSSGSVFYPTTKKRKAEMKSDFLKIVFVEPKYTQNDNVPVCENERKGFYGIHFCYLVDFILHTHNFRNFGNFCSSKN